MKTTRLAPTRCPWCDYELDAASDPLSYAEPAPGDLTLCLECGEWSVFEEGFKLRKPNTDEYDVIAADQDARDIRAAWLQMRATNPRVA